MPTEHFGTQTCWCPQTPCKPSKDQFCMCKIFCWTVRLHLHFCRFVMMQPAPLCSETDWWNRTEEFSECWTINRDRSIRKRNIWMLSCMFQPIMKSKNNRWEQQVVFDIVQINSLSSIMQQAINVRNKSVKTHKSRFSCGSKKMNHINLGHVLKTTSTMFRPVPDGYVFKINQNQTWIFLDWKHNMIVCCVPTVLVWKRPINAWSNNAKELLTTTPFCLDRRALK